LGKKEFIVMPKIGIGGKKKKIADGRE